MCNFDSVFFQCQYLNIQYLQKKLDNTHIQKALLLTMTAKLQILPVFEKDSYNSVNLQFACFHRGRASPRRATHTQKSLFLLWLQAIQKFATRPNKVTGFTNVMGRKYNLILYLCTLVAHIRATAHSTLFLKSLQYISLDFYLLRKTQKTNCDS